MRLDGLAGRIVQVLLQLGQMMENAFDQPRVTVAVTLVQILGIQERADLCGRPRQRRQSLLT
jgi:hypothetical protein